MAGGVDADYNSSRMDGESVAALQAMVAQEAI